MAAVIGALRADLSAGWAEFAADMGKAADSVRTFSKTFKSTAAEMRSIGATMSAALTLPLVAFGAATVTGAKDFEAGMNRVKAATQATSAQMTALTKEAREVGVDPTNTANAIEAAEAMETLAKNGLTVSQILGGALDATTKLAAATGSELAPAADVATDVMLQFGKSAKDLGPVVNGITGTLLASKFGFDDYRLALGQAGGVAGGLGVEFTEFNAVIAATSALFGSGSDAGTSFKTFLTSLSGNSKEAKDAIKAYGLEFYDANGNMRSMVEITQELQDKLGGLNDQAKTDVLKRIFGTDAMRTAIGLMTTGAEKLAELDAQIQKASAQEQMDARMAGLSGALKELSKAFLELRLAIAGSGFLDFLTGAVKMAADLARGLAGLPGPLLSIATGFGIVAAAIGPALFIAGSFMGAMMNLAPLMAGAGLAITRFAAVIPGATAALGGLRVAMAFLMGPWGLAILAVATAVGVLAYQMSKAPPPTRETEAAVRALTASTDAYEEAAMAAAVATGKEAASAKVAAEEKRKQALANRAAAAAKLQEAQATIALITAENMRRINAENAPGGNRGDRPGSLGYRNGDRRQAESDAAALRAQITAADDQVKRADAAIAAAQKAADAAAAPVNLPGIDLSGGAGRSGGRNRNGPTVAELETQARIEAARLSNDWRTVDALEAQEEIRKRAKAYQEAGLAKSAAQAKAEGEVANVTRLRNEEYARNLDAMAEGIRLTVAQTAGDYATAQAIQDAQEKRQRILDYQREGVTLAEAERKATFDAAQIDAARADARARWRTDDVNASALRNAQARGDADEVERLERTAAIRARVVELQREQLMAGPAAQAQAEAEAADLRLSQMIGKWRSFSAETFRNEYARGIAELNTLLANGKLTLEEYTNAAAGLRDTLHDGLANASPMFKDWASSVDLIGDSLMEALKPGADLGDIWASFRLELLKILVLTPAIEKLKSALKGLGEGGGGGGLSSGGGGGGGWLNAAVSIGAKIFGGFRAKGGSVVGNRAYVVGEEGPELFQPGRSGAIIPNDALTSGPSRGGITIHAPVTVDARDAVLASWVEERVAQGMQQAIQTAVPIAIRGAAEVVPEEMMRRGRDSF